MYSKLEGGKMFLILKGFFLIKGKNATPPAINNENFLECLIASTCPSKTFNV